MAQRLKTKHWRVKLLRQVSSCYRLIADTYLVQQLQRLLCGLEVGVPRAQERDESTPGRDTPIHIKRGSKVGSKGVHTSQDMQKGCRSCVVQLIVTVSIEMYICYMLPTHPWLHDGVIDRGTVTA
eukprot:1184377-Prorocentrum_minimum.AAC.3